MTDIDVEPINRRALVDRHRIRLTEPSPEHVLSVGNGDFAVTVDASGMQSFAEYHSQSDEAARTIVAADGPADIMAGRPVVDTSTMSTWGWHESPCAEPYSLEDTMSEYDTARGPVRYPDRYDEIASMQDSDPAADLRAGTWLHQNPHRVDLGRIGLEFRRSVGGDAETTPSALEGLDQQQDLWTGTITSTYRYDDVPVSVTTVADPDRDVVAYRIASRLLTSGRARIAIRFPRPSAGFFATDPWGRPETHHTEVTDSDLHGLTIRRVLDATSYHVEMRASSAVTVDPSDDPHLVVLEAADDALDLVVRFSPTLPDDALPDFDTVAHRAAAAGTRFWERGAALDLGAVDDPRAAELERRIVLSQHLTRLHSAGTLPPQETGLVTNSWQGKFHLEMHFWHAAHFAMWGRPDLLARSMHWYRDVLPRARATAAQQGYAGARWPKQIGPEGRESPTGIGALLIWQQPHPIHLLELLWAGSDEAGRASLLDDFGELVEETATFMADYPELRDGVRHLGSPVMPAQEFYDARTTVDPTFELGYWWYGLEIAQQWRIRAGRDRNTTWTEVQDSLARPAQRDGRYLAVASTETLRRDDHPSLLAALGVVPPTPLIDETVMDATLNDVLANWDWSTAWGWDFPMIAMTATRLGRRDVAVDALLRNERRNRANPVGHNPQLGPLLPIYLPGNGGLLAAVSMMSDLADDGHPKGFPADWTIRAEGFTPWPDPTPAAPDDTPLPHSTGTGDPE